MTFLDKKFRFKRAFPVPEYKTRNRKAKELMEKNNIDALLLAQRMNIEYFSGALNTLWHCLDRTFAMVLPREGDPVLIIPTLLQCVTERTTWVKDVRCYASPRKNSERIGCPATIAATLEDLGLDRSVIGMESGYDMRINMPLREFEAIKGGIPDARFVDAYDVIWGCRVLKSKLEIERIEKASDITCDAIKTVFEKRIKEGMTEFDYSREMAMAFLEGGGDPQEGFFYVGVMSDPWLGPMLDRAPTNRRIGKGDVLVADCGAGFGGYTSDMTRWAVLGKPPKKMEEFHDLAVQSTISANEAVRPNIPISNLVEAANVPFRKAGLPMAIARIGHGLGLETHEPPGLSVDNSDLIQPDMIFTIEPCLFADNFIFWVEDTILVTKTGCRNLTPLPKDLWRIG